jgi:hypothetical protein
MGRVKELYFDIIQEYGSTDNIPKGLTISEFLKIINKKKQDEALEEEIIPTGITNTVHNNLCSTTTIRTNTVH